MLCTTVPSGGRVGWYAGGTSPLEVKERGIGEGPCEESTGRKTEAVIGMKIESINESMNQ